MAADVRGALMVMLLAFTIRDAYIYGSETYPADGITDAALALIFLLADEALTLQWAPALAMSKPVFFRGSVACLALLTMFRMLSRPLPQADPSTPIWPGLPPEGIYWRMVRLNVLWIFMFYFSIGMFVADGPSTIDNVRGSLPGAAFVTWIALQTNRLARRNFIQQLETDPRRLRLSRMVETLPQGMKKGDPLYSWYVALEGLIFLMGAANIGVELWWWLHGESTAGTARLRAMMRSSPASPCSRFGGWPFAPRLRHPPLHRRSRTHDSESHHHCSALSRAAPVQDG